MVSVGEKIKAYLKEKGISQKWLALETCISPAKLNLALNGHRRLTFEEFEYICYALNVPVSTFLEPKKPVREGDNC